MGKYAVKLLLHAYRDLDGIYAYIAETLLEPGAAQKLMDALEEAIFGLEELPQRGALRKMARMPVKAIASFSSRTSL